MWPLAGRVAPVRETAVARSCIAPLLMVSLRRHIPKAKRFRQDISDGLPGLRGNANAGSADTLGRAPAAGSSALAHALGGLRRAARMDLFIDALACDRVDVLPVLEGTIEHGAVDATEKAPRHLINESVSLRIVKDLAHQRARLPEIVIFRVKGIGAADHLTIALP